MEELLKKIEEIINKQLFETTNSFVDKLVEIGIEKQNIKIYTTNGKTEVSIVLPNVSKTIDIKIDTNDCEIV